MTARFSYGGHGTNRGARRGPSRSPRLFVVSLALLLASLPASATATPGGPPRQSGTVVLRGMQPGGTSLLMGTDVQEATEHGGHVPAPRPTSPAGLAEPAAATYSGGGYQRPGITELVSVTPDGATGNYESAHQKLSSDGRFVAFGGAASNLVAGDTDDRPDVFVRDRRMGTTELVSLPRDGKQLYEGHVNSISGDGRYVVFTGCEEEAAACGDLNVWAVFVRDRATGTTELVSVSSDGAAPNAHTADGEISADGRFVAFASFATNLVAGDTNGALDTFVHDRETGRTERVSVASDGSQGQGGASGCHNHRISGDGRFIAFECGFDNLVEGDTNGWYDAFVRDRDTDGDGVFDEPGSVSTERVSVGPDGTELPLFGLSAGHGTLSQDGRFVTFGVAGGYMSTTHTNVYNALYMRDRATGTIERVSVNSDGTEMYAGNQPSISADGRHIAFICHERGEQAKVCLRDRATGTTEYVSVDPDGTLGHAVFGPGTSMSADARYVSWTDGRVGPSIDDGGNAMAGDTNEHADVVLRDRGPATGIGGLTVQEGAGQHGVMGWATFSGSTVASAEDSPTDGVDDIGAEMTTASVIHRPEAEDLLIRIDLASLPVTVIPGAALPWPVPEETRQKSYAGAPGTQYRLRFDVAQTAYEVRALPAGPITPARVALYECTPSCSETATLGGAVGTTGPGVHVSLPLDVLGVDGAADLTQLEASVTPPESPVPVDTLALPDAHIEPPQVRLGVASLSTPAGQVPFTSTADLAEGRFAATLDTSAGSGPQRLWARGCLGVVCGFLARDL